VSGRYYVELVDVLEAAGVRCQVGDQNAGWETRARSSGGYAAAPLGVCWHHTASRTTPANDLAYMCHGSDDAPIGNLLLDRDGIVWPIAAGAANTQGKGGPATFSRGTSGVDTGNSTIWGAEVANDGVGEPWPAVQIDAYFAMSNALADLFGNLPTDVITHGGPSGWAPSRKIDPATAAAVQGWWIPGAVTSSGTWDLADIRAECARRAGLDPQPQPPEPPPDQGDIDMASTVLILDDARDPYARYRCAGAVKTWVSDGNASAQLELRLAESEGGTRPAVDGFVYTYMKHGDNAVIASYGPIVGPLPGVGFDVYGRH